MTVTPQFAGMVSPPKILNVVLFLLSSLVTGPSFMSTSSLVLELWPFTFRRNWLEIQKSEIPPSEFCQISADWGELRIPNYMSLMKFYSMLKIVRVTAFKVSELLRENQQGVILKILEILKHLILKDCYSIFWISKLKEKW